MLSQPCPQQRSLHCSIRAEIPRAAPRGAERDKAGSLRTPERSFGEVFTVLGAGIGVRICPEQWANQQSVCWGWAPSRGCLFSKLFLFFLFVFYIQSPESKHHIRAQGLKMTLETKKLLLNMGEPRGKAVKIVHKQQLGSFLCSQTSGTCLFTFAQTHLT